MWQRGGPCTSRSAFNPLFTWRVVSWLSRAPRDALLAGGRGGATVVYVPHVLVHLNSKTASSTHLRLYSLTFPVETNAKPVLSGVCSHA
jgi:hypothetical protein